MKDIYKCMVCGKIYRENELKPIINGGDGCCSIRSLIEFEPLTQTRMVIIDFGKTDNEPNIQKIDGKN
jgi:hypothetical protein